MRNAIFEKKLIWRSKYSMWTQNRSGVDSLTNRKFSSSNSSVMFDAFSGRRYNFKLRVDLAPLRAWLLRVLT